ncbi:MAG: CHASE3 domain-containing protein [Bacteroidota bacterium]
MTNRFQSVFIAMYVFVIILFLGLAYFSNQTLEKVEGYIVVLGHDHEVVKTFEDILLSLSRAESNRRGYLLSEDKQFLGNYNDAVLSLQKSLQHLRVLNRNGRYQDAVLDSLESKIDRRVASLQASLQLAIRDTSADSIQVIFTDRGSESMKLIRGTINSLLDERNGDRSDIYFDLNDFVSDVQSLYAGVMIIAFCSFPVIGLVAYFQFRRVRITEMALRQDLALAQQQIQHATSRYLELKQRLEEKTKTEGDALPHE